MGILRTLYYKFKLNRNLNKSREEIKSLQEKKFRSLLFHAYDNSKFYRGLYKSEGIKREDLSEIKITDLPVVNKEKIMSNFNKNITVKGITKNKVEKFLENSPEPASFFNNNYKIIHSSGSTGRLGYFIYSKNEWDLIKAVSLRMFGSFGLKAKRYAFIGASDGHYAGISLFLSPINQFEEIFYEDYLIININKEVDNYIKKLNNLKPHNLTGYPSALRILAEYQLEGKLNISPETIICGGEPFLENDKKIIKEAWGVEAVNYYAASESLMLGIKKAEDNNIYLMEDINLIEIKDNKTLITNLYNYTQPLIRYEMSDVLKKAQNEEKNWPFTQIEKLIGRREEIIYFKNEKGKEDFLHPIALAEFYVKGLKRFQILKDGQESFTMKVLINENEDKIKVKKKIKNKMNKILAEKNMKNVNFKVKEVKELKADPDTGKFKLIKVV
ncbi:MAG: hypothetical protein ACQEQF_01535 [Bacillota bacterium]